MFINNGNLACKVKFAGIIKENIGVIRDLLSREIKQLCEEVNLKVKLSTATFELRILNSNDCLLTIYSMHQMLSSKIAKPFGNVASYVLPGHKGNPASKEAAKLVNEFVANSAVVLRKAEVNKRRKIEGKIPAEKMLFCSIKTI